MQTATYVALSRQAVLDRQMDVIANNLANMSTSGFKTENQLFQEYLEPSPVRGQTIAYVRDAGVVRDLRQGDLSRTGNPLDVGIDGNGYFQVNTVDGPRYTRNGRFQLDAGRTLVTAQGYQVLDSTGQPITIPQGSTSISIGADGTVATETGPVGKIALSSFANGQDVVPAGNGLYVTSATPTPDTVSTLHQGMLEDSNVRPIIEMTQMLGVQRAYASAQNIIDSEDNRLRNAIDKLSKSS
ncbi:flagellar basal-body rod protein FlgF [Aliidongia dinghuensis]|uniref:Flagellar basal-body rod protein FlgF n=1 Tax=Aliidongia dinghuensis TaxID=1867774 RepID=A0A8J3E5X6_9PROT|nr:flagellar basal-body rod protein FlgF [Aliidongia dinghuensis]GGF38949.1 flagellar basal-body rod protein FlgF [Aliidongia dinghuensis]